MRAQDNDSGEGDPVIPDCEVIMLIRSFLAGVGALALSVAEANASGISRGINSDCAGGSLQTCASVRVKFNRLVPTSAALSVDNLTTTIARPLIISTWQSDGRQLECRPGGRDCRESEDPTTVTPEPVTMTLLATGLVGLGAAGRLRRRLNPGREGPSLI